MAPILRFSDPAGPVQRDPKSTKKRAELTRARRFLAAYYIVLPLLLVYLLFKVFPTYPWPVVDKATNELVSTLPIVFFRWAVPTSLEDRLLLLVIVAGALGSYIHSATSYSDFRGNRQFNTSWTLWYVLRPLIGVCLALVLYFATRGGLLLLIINGKDATSAGSINPFGVAAVAGLTGMFSKQAADKLAEVFTTLFKADADNQRKDSLMPDVPPVIRSIDPVEGPAEGGTEITITGTGFTSTTKVFVGDEEATKVVFVNETTIKAETPEGEAGPTDVVVVNVDEQKSTSVKGYNYLDAASETKPETKPETQPETKPETNTDTIQSGDRPLP